MPTATPAPRVARARDHRTVRSTSLRALAVAAHLERNDRQPAETSGAEDTLEPAVGIGAGAAADREPGSAPR